MSESSHPPSSLASLAAGMRIRGLVGQRAVTVVAVDLIDQGLAEVFYRDDAGSSGARMVTDEEIAEMVEVSARESAPAFDADPDEFRLAAEALRT